MLRSQGVSEAIQFLHNIADIAGGHQVCVVVQQEAVALGKAEIEVVLPCQLPDVFAQNDELPPWDLGNLYTRLSGSAAMIRQSRLRGNPRKNVSWHLSII